MDLQNIDLAELITVKQAAALVNVTPLTIRRWQKNRGLGEIRLGRNVYTTEHDLKQFARNCTLQNQAVSDSAQASIDELNELLEGGK